MATQSYLYCPYCGSGLPGTVSNEGRFCPYCGNAFFSSTSDQYPVQNLALPPAAGVSTTPASAARVKVIEQRRPSLAHTVAIGFVWLLLLGWIPIVGPLIAGYKTGSLAETSVRGLIAGFIVGILSTVVIASLIAILGGLVGDILFGIRGAGLGALLSGTVGGIVLLVYGAGDILACTLGGLIGGSIKEGSMAKQFATSPLQHLFSADSGTGNYLIGRPSSSTPMKRNNFQSLMLSFLQSGAGMMVLRTIIESIFA